MVRGRFAPSPSGRMHLGNLFCALLSYLSVKSRGGEWILRIEDLDTARCRPDYARQVEEDLRWLGLAWDEGGSAGGPDAPYFQSERTALYEAALARLRGMGLVYPCFCTRAQLHAASAPHREDGLTVYPGTCRGLTPEDIARREAAGRKGALRLRVPEETVTFTDGHLGEVTEYLPTDCGDFLLRRSDGLFAYQLAVVVDDAAMGVTEVVRGADLLSSTPRQLLLYELLGWEAPEFYHFPLLLSLDGRRLSKRDGDLGLGALRERYTPEEIIGKLAYLAGQNPGGGPRTPEALAEDFHWDAVPRRDIPLPEGLF
ncbi:MAG: tRNA glutamyl-Q(34) synthetase GluQRS [Dysosmobacter sp.]|nr:tRNA glutamyl-Q(34) synthetase GluQRS [Dysosmobacter sp.]